VYYARILNNNNDREYVRQAWLVQRTNERIERDERSPSRQGLDSACLPQLSQAGRGGAQAHSNTPCGEHPKPHARGATPPLLLCSPVFSWLSGCIFILFMLYQLFLFLLSTMILTTGYNLQHITTSTSVISVFSLPVTNPILDLTILKFMSWITNLRK
jgi:hypothetical protein